MKYSSNKTLFLIISFFFLFSFVFSVPFHASAVEFLPLVQCNTSSYPTECKPCHIFELIQRILNFLWWGISIPAAALMFAYGGFLMINPVGAVTSREKGKKVITNVLFGLAIVFFAWLAVDTIIKVFVGGQQVVSGATAKIENLGPWNKIKCSELPKFLQ